MHFLNSVCFHRLSLDFILLANLISYAFIYLSLPTTEYTLYTVKELKHLFICLPLLLLLLLLLMLLMVMVLTAVAVEQFLSLFFERTNERMYLFDTGTGTNPKQILQIRIYSTLHLNLVNMMPPPAKKNQSKSK